MRITFAVMASVLAAAPALRPTPPPAQCDLSNYRPGPGLTASSSDDALIVSWKGDSASELRARFGILAGHPVIRDLQSRSGNASWTTVGENLEPEYRVVTGVRRMSNQQA